METSPSGPKTIYLRDLPPELNPGCRVPLVPLGALSHRLTSCDACGAFTPRRILSSCGHTFCVGCCMAVESADGMDVRCVTCKEICCGSITEMNERVLRTLKFGCRCGLEGNLIEIKDHIWKGEVEHDFPNIRSTAGPATVSPTKSRGTGRMMSVPTFQTKGFFWMQVQELSVKCQSTGQMHKSNVAQEWKAGGYVFDLICQVQPGTEKTDQFVGIAIRTPPNKPSASAWPIRKRIIIQLHNTEGKAIVRKDVITFDNGKVISDVFVAPSASSFYVIDRLFKYKDLQASSGISKDGFACFSVELRSLQA